MSGRLFRAAHASGVERYSSSLAEILAPASSRMLGALDARRERPPAHVTPTRRVQRRGALPVRQVRGPCRSPAAGEGSPGPPAGRSGTRSAPAARARRRSSSRTTRSRLPSVAAAVNTPPHPAFAALRIGRHPPHHLVVFVQPDEVVAVEDAAARDEQGAQLAASSPPTWRCPRNRRWRSDRRRDRAAARPSRDCRRARPCGARILAAPRRLPCQLGSAPRSSSSARDRVVAELDGRRQRPLAAGPRLANAVWLLVKESRSRERGRRARPQS